MILLQYHIVMIVFCVIDYQSRDPKDLAISRLSDFASPVSMVSMHQDLTGESFQGECRGGCQRAAIHWAFRSGDENGQIE